MEVKKERKGIIRVVSQFFVALVKKYLPSPFTLAVILSLLVFILSITVAGASFLDMTSSFSNGLFSLLPFTMQMVLVLVTGHALASSPVVGRFLNRIASIPKNNVQSITFTCMVAYICSYINWAFGLIAGAIIAREIAAQNHGKKIHYPLIIAAAYSGNIVRGFASSIPLSVATEGHIVQETTGIIPVSETLFAPYNIIITILLFVAIPILYKYMIPSESDSIEISLGKLKDTETKSSKVENINAGKTFAEKIDRTPILAFITAIVWSIHLIIHFSTKGLSLDLNTVILIFFTLGLFAHKNLENYSKAISDGVSTASGIILQFPFYAAIMAMMKDSGLAIMISQAFTQFATAQTLPVLTFGSAGLVNFFIPSGGGQWAVQGPIMIEAAEALGADFGKVTMALAWGDSWTNQVQPFWALPALAIAGLDVKDIMGYCIMVFLLSGIIISGVLLLA